MRAEQDPRFQMWCRLIPGIEKLHGSARKTAKKAFAYPNDPTHYNPLPEDYLKAMDYCEAPGNYINEVCKVSLAPSCPTVAKGWTVCSPLPKPEMGQAKKAKPMYDDFETPIQTRTDETRKRDYLQERLYEVSDTKYQEARAAFNLDAPHPETLEDLFDRIKKGKFTVDEKSLKKRSWYIGDLVSRIDWHDPKHPADEAGFEAANAKKHEALAKAKDVIMIGDPADGLKALQDFESATFH